MSDNHHNSSDLPALTSLNSEVMYKATGINLLATGSTLVVPVVSGKKFIPRRVEIRLASLTGTFIVTPILRVGNNGNHDNVAALTTVSGLTAVDKMQTFTVVITDVISLNSAGISVEVQTAGTVATVATADVFISGLLI